MFFLKSNKSHKKLVVLNKIPSQFKKMDLRIEDLSKIKVLIFFFELIFLLKHLGSRKSRIF